jgi:hypothetical protein
MYSYPLRRAYTSRPLLCMAPHASAARCMWDRQDKIQETNKASMSQPTAEVCCGKNMIWILDMTKFNNTCRLDVAIGYIDCLVNKKTEIRLQPNNLSSEGGFMLS